MKHLLSSLRQHRHRALILLAVLASGLSASAQSEPQVQYRNITDYMSNPWIMALSLLALILLFAIISMGRTLATLAELRLRRGKDTTLLVILATSTMLLLSSTTAYARGSSIEYIPEEYVYGLLLGVIALEALAILVMTVAMGHLMKPEGSAAPKEIIAQPSLWARFLAVAQPLKSIEQEQEQMLDHDYDGIHELSNGMPPWLQWIFQGTIVFAIGYLLYYHVLGMGKLSIEEYKQDMANAEKAVAAYRARAANLVDENTVTFLTDATALTAGRDIFSTNCATCHGRSGEGLAGPNLTDAYWIHGGSAQDLFKVVKYGIAEKGMKSWQNDLSPAQIQQVVSYVRSLQGTNPPNALEPQGELYVETADATPTDSTAAKVK